MICTSTSVRSRQPNQMLFSSWLGISTTQTKERFPNIHQHTDFPTRGKNTLDFVLHHPRGAYKGHTPPPPRSLRPHHCHANSCIQTARLKSSNQFTNRYKCGQKGRQRHFKTVLTQLTGICLIRLPHTTTLQTSKSTQRLSLPTSPTLQVYWWL